MTRKSIALPVIICISALFLLLFAGVVYRTGHAKTEIMTSESIDGEYWLVIYMVGEPDFPFGATHCLLELFHDDKKLAKQSFSVLNDGAAVQESNFNILWNKSDVTVTASGSEQEDAVYVLRYDGADE